MTTTLTARCPEDLLALVPVVLGFTPTESVVMLTFGPRRAFHARIDLPPPEAAHEVLEALRAPALRHAVDRVVLVLYARDARPAERVGRVLRRGLREAGIDVIDLIRADGHRWYPLLPGRRRDRETGVPYDVSTHPFTVQGVVDGRVTHDSRAALAGSLAPDPDAVAAIAGCLRGAAPAGPVWVAATVARLARSREVPSPAVTARLLQALGDPDCRDAAWAGVARADASAHVELWTGLLRRAPDEVAADAAAVLALTAWLAGHGALAWCAIDRAEELRPGDSLARLVADLLGSAVSPDDWEEVWRGAHPASDGAQPA